MTLQRLPLLVPVVSYVEFTANVTVSGTSGAQTTVVTATAFTPNGTDAYWIEFYSVEVIASAADFVVLELWDGATDLGRIGTVGSSGLATPVTVRRKVTPSNATHTYAIKAWRNVANGTVVAGNGGAVTDLPGYISITKAT